MLDSNGGASRSEQVNPGADVAPRARRASLTPMPAPRSAAPVSWAVVLTLLANGLVLGAGFAWGILALGRTAESTPVQPQAPAIQRPPGWLRFAPEPAPPLELVLPEVPRPARIVPAEWGAEPELAPLGPPTDEAALPEGAYSWPRDELGLADIGTLVEEPAPMVTAESKADGAVAPEAAPARPAPPAAPLPDDRTHAIEDPVPLDVPPPPYPRAAVRAGEQGTVLCRLSLSTEGRVTGVEVLETSGFERLDEAAREGLKGWRFQPRRIDGKPVEGTVLHRVTFRLDR